MGLVPCFLNSIIDRGRCDADVTRIKGSLLTILATFLASSEVSRMFVTGMISFLFTP